MYGRRKIYQYHVVCLSFNYAFRSFIFCLLGNMKRKSEKENKIKTVMSEFKHKELHSGSKKGPIITNRKQAVAVAMSEARKKK